MKNLNTPASRQGNFVRYAVYMVLYLIMLGCRYLGTFNDKFHIWGAILFVIFAAPISLFYIRQFNHEQKYFVKSVKLSLLSDYIFTLGLTLLVIATRIMFSYLQSKKTIPKLNIQVFYNAHESNGLFWFYIFALGIVLPILQQYLTNGFFFNYFFRDNSGIVALLGIFASGLFFSILNLQFSLAIFVVNWLFGMLFAWSYLYTQSIWMPIYLSVLNGVLIIILI